jgi:hypothetical protein
VKGVWALTALALLAAVPASATEDPWAGVRRLLGTWEGSGSGFGETAPVRHTWSFVFDGTFLRLETVSGDPGAQRGDVGYLSRDTDTGRLVFRQFFSEGYVNTYDVTAEAPGDTVVFAHRETESAGGMGARLVLVFTGPESYEMTLELAAPGKEFAACQTMTMQRQR